MRMPSLLRFFPVLLALTAPIPASSEIVLPVLPLYFLNPNPGALVNEAFAQPYGKLLADEFAKVIAESADPACVKAKGLQPSQFNERARAILVRTGTHYIELTAKAIDRTKYRANMETRKGAGWNADYDRAKADPSVQKWIAMQRP